MSALWLAHLMSPGVSWALYTTDFMFILYVRGGGGGGQLKPNKAEGRRKYLEADGGRTNRNARNISVCTHCVSSK
jgi:hypothetical protein